MFSIKNLTSIIGFSYFLLYINFILTPIPNIPIPGITFSKAIDCSTLGVPYMAPKQLDIEETYSPASSNTRITDTFAAIIKSSNRATLVQVAPRNITKTKYKKVPVLIAASVPLGMLVDGALRSPLILIPDRIPVIVGKNTPKTVNQL